MTGVYKHLLLPTDGSTVSEEAAAAGIALARALGARVTALHVVTDSAPPSLETWAHHDPKFGANLGTVLEKRGAVYLETIRDAALRAGVSCDCRLARGTSLHAEIMAASLDAKCDLIVMASHGRRGDGGTLFGSETIKAATLGMVPVLVHRKLRSLKGHGR